MRSIWAKILLPSCSPHCSGPLLPLPLPHFFPTYLLMGKPRTVVLAVAARGELLAVASSAACALGNLLCLSMPPDEGLPRLGICSLSLSPTTGKAQLQVRPPGSFALCTHLSPLPWIALLLSQVRLRPGDINLRDFHAAALKLKQSPCDPALDGAQLALALQSLAGVLLKESGGSRSSSTSIVLITDRLPPADDFSTYLEVSVGAGSLSGFRLYYFNF